MSYKSIVNGRRMKTNLKSLPCHCISSGSTLFVKVNKIFRQNNTIFFENYNLIPLIYTMNYPKLIVSNQKEESIISIIYKGIMGCVCMIIIFLFDGLIR